MNHLVCVCAHPTTAQFSDRQHHRDTAHLNFPTGKLAFAVLASWLLLLPAEAATFRYSATSNRIYVESGGGATLSDIHNALPNAPLELVDATNKIWLARATLFVADGCTLFLNGDVDGDVNELRLLSNNTGAPDSVVGLEADWGALDLTATRVTSWNEAVNGPDTEYQTYERAFIRVRSRQVGGTNQQSVLNVMNSDIGYLGFVDSDNYGLNWQVMGAVPGLKVFGTVSGSRIHNCQLGLSTWSVDDVNWVSNEIAFNTHYGFNPADPGHQTVLANNNVHDDVFIASVRYASTGNRIYVENFGTATLSDIKHALPNAPLELVDATNKIWLLRANLFVDDGCTLNLRGAAAGGDVNELRLLSNNTGATNSVVIVDADQGTLNLESTRVTSWNEAVNGPDTEYQTFQRAFIRARSRQVSGTNYQSTLNVVDSDVGYLGFEDSESYGLTWQVVSSVPGVQVFGTVSGSVVHHCQLGVKTWSADDVGWTNNVVTTNTLYGFDSTDAGHQAVLASNNVHDNAYVASFRWASSSQRIYVTGPGAGTLTQLKAAAPSAPLTLVDPVNKVWYLAANLFIENGAQLNLYGPANGGDVGELRIKSDNTTNGTVEIRADYGWLDIRNTKITSWDSAVNGPDTETSTYGRSFIRARSTLAPDGVTPRESRMDIISSDVGYLGSDDTEAYGVVWKVVATSAPTNMPPGQIFDLVNVYGDILNSRLHHNYFGMYSYGHLGGHWANNEFDNNIGYGIDPHDDSDQLLIENNNVHHNGLHGIIASQRCDGGILRSNVSWANGQNGIMLHRTSDNWLVERNQSYLNGDSGIAIFASSSNLIRNNICLSNSNHGMRLSVGANDNVVTNNFFGYSGANGFRLYQDDDIPNAGDDGRPKRNLFINNTVLQYGAEAFKAEHSDWNILTGNTFSSTNTTTIRFDEATNNVVAGNAIPVNSVIKSTGGTGVLAYTTIKQQPQFILQLDTFSTATFRDEAGAVFDFGQPQLFTPVGPTGSVAVISRANVGSSVQVFTRNLFVGLDGGSVQAVPTTWNTSGFQTKAWTSRLSPGTVTVAYTVGDLTPGSTHAVAIGTPAVPLGSYIANPQGRITFFHSNNNPGVGATNNFTVVIEKENSAPTLPFQPDRAIDVLTLLTVTNTAADSDLPPATVTYTLYAMNLANNNIVTNAAISSDGIITWTPSNAQGSTTNRFTTIASDGYLTATNSFLVTVGPAVIAPTALKIARTTTNTVVLQWPASPPGWVLQQNAVLGTANWAGDTNPVSVVGNQNQVIIAPSIGRQFFRLFHQQ